MRRVTLALLLTLALASVAEAKTIPASHQILGYALPRTFDEVGYVPVLSIEPRVLTIRIGGNRYRGPWTNATVGGKSTTGILRIIRKHLRYRIGWQHEGVFADRPLTANERKTFRVAADLWRNADVLVVARDHVACSGITRAQARAIATRRITRWSAIGALPAGHPDPISVQVVGDPSGKRHERRMGTPAKLPAGVRIARDGGVSAALQGDRSIAAVTSWSRVRDLRSGCVVPLDGVAPTDASVHALRYPEAYAVTFVVPRKRIRDAYQREVRKRYLDFLLGKKASDLFRARGLLLAKETPAPPTTAPAPAASEPGPSQDRQGRPVTSVRDDDAVRAAFTGVRLSRTGATSLERFTFEPDSVLKHLQSNEAGCQLTTGQWQLLAGWRYAEYGGGVIARLHLQLEAARDVTVELPGDAPGTGYIDSQPYERSPDAPSGCG